MDGVERRKQVKRSKVDVKAPGQHACRCSRSTKPDWREWEHVGQSAKPSQQNCFYVIMQHKNSLID